MKRTWGLSPSRLTLVTAVVLSAIATMVAGKVSAAPSQLIECPQSLTRCYAYVRFGLAQSTFSKSSSPAVATSLAHRNDLPSWFEDFTAPLLSGEQLSVFAKEQIPIVTWEPALPGARASADVLAEIAAGARDKYLRASAANVVAQKRPIIVRFAHEMNGYWYPWGIPKGGDPRSKAFPSHTAALYVSAFRHVVEVMRAAGASNVMWMWSPNLIDASPLVLLSSLYPGNDVVDLVGVSAYLYTEGTNFTQRFATTAAQLESIAPTKPVIVAETSVGAFRERSQAVSQLLAEISRTPRISGVVWLNAIDKGVDFRLLKDDGSLDAARAALTAAPYVRAAGATYATVSLPVVSGEAQVGESFTARWVIRGVAKSVQVTWKACTMPVAARSCQIVRTGPTLPVTPNLWHMCVSAAVSARSLLGIDAAQSPCTKQILAVPIAPSIDVMDLRGTSIRVALPAMNQFADRFLLSIDGKAKVYMPATTTEYWFSGLTPSTAHSITVAFVDQELPGQEWTAGVTLVQKPPAAAVRSSGGIATAALPSVVAGQTGWVVQLDADPPVTLSIDDLSWSVSVTSGKHVIMVRRSSGIATTNPQGSYFTAS